MRDASKLPDHGFDWTKLAGSADGLYWSRVDLGNLRKALALVPEHRVAVQAGGNLGLFPAFLARSFDRVYTFEPDGENFAALCRNAPGRNIFKLQAVLGDERGTVKLSRARRDEKKVTHEGAYHVPIVFDEDAGAESGGHGDWRPAPGPVPTIRIDDLNLPICDLIYLDVEGFEFRALLGASCTIARCKPVIAVEMNRQLQLAGSSDEELIGGLERAGYREALAVRSDRVFVPVKGGGE